MEMRIGHGTDLHRLLSGRPLILGGVRIESDVGCLGHSDADALLHAITDALLGALALGDIGQHFPDSDPQWRGADSRKLLSAIFMLVRNAGWRVSNLDATVSTELPKLAPHIPAIRQSIAGMLETELSQISVKAKTNEGMDAVGRREALAVHAVVLLVRD